MNTNKTTKVSITVNEYRNLLEAKNTLDTVTRLFANTDRWMFEDVMNSLGFLSKQKLEAIRKKESPKECEGLTQGTTDYILCETTNQRKEVNTCKQNQEQPDVNTTDVGMLPDENLNVLRGA